MMHRRTVLKSALAAMAAGTRSAALLHAQELGLADGGVSVRDAQPGEDIFAFVQRTVGRFDARRYKQILGAANPFKEGDQIVGVAAADGTSRARARELLAATRIELIDSHP